MQNALFLTSDLLLFLLFCLCCSGGGSAYFDAGVGIGVASAIFSAVSFGGFAVVISLLLVKSDREITTVTLVSQLVYLLSA